MMKIRRKHIRALVTQILDSHGIRKPPVNVFDLAKRIGLIVSFQQNDDDTLSGFLFRDSNSGQAIVGVNAGHHENRQRFTIAHEIGHFLLHNTSHEVHVDKRFVLHRRDQNSSQGTDPHEREANFFAAELLMPESMVRADLAKDFVYDLGETESNSIAQLANRYQVSLAAMSYRLASLGYIEI